jgi:hypothetical protein
MMFGEIIYRIKNWASIGAEEATPLPLQQRREREVPDKER